MNNYKILAPAIHALISLFFYSCAPTSIKLNYPFNEKNRLTIRKAFTAGNVSCRYGYCDCAVHGGPGWVEKLDTNSNKYTLGYSGFLFLSFDCITKGEKNNSSIKVSVKYSDDIFKRNRTIENYFLEELRRNLLDSNQDIVKDYFYNYCNKWNEAVKNIK